MRPTRPTRQPAWRQTVPRTKRELERDVSRELRIHTENLRNNKRHSVSVAKTREISYATQAVSEAFEKCELRVRVRLLLQILHERGATRREGKMSESCWATPHLARVVPRRSSLEKRIESTSHSAPLVQHRATVQRQQSIVSSTRKEAEVRSR